VRQPRDPPAIDARAEELENRAQHRHRSGDGACDDDDRAGRDAVEDLRADDEHPGHRDHDGCAGDDDRASRRACCALERFVRRDPALPLAARSDDVEERVVDSDRHADQDDDDLDAVVEREELADRTEQSERGGHGGECEQNRHERGHDRTEREQEHE
jgi:hypothetical protein